MRSLVHFRPESRVILPPLRDFVETADVIAQTVIVTQCDFRNLADERREFTETLLVLFLGRFLGRNHVPYIRSEQLYRLRQGFVPLSQSVQPLVSVHDSLYDAEI